MGVRTAVLRASSRPAAIRGRPRGRAWLAAAGLLALTLWFPLNWAYQVLRKPSELLAPVSAGLRKAPAATWRAYGAAFRAHSTPLISPTFLAALAQAESDGNPLAGTYWRWKWTWNPFELYAPASSAVGMFQMTRGTFDEARRYCIHDHRAVQAGPWHDLDACWFNGLYTRLLPSHAIEMTAARLHVTVTELLATRRRRGARPEQIEALAAVVHLCGRQGGAAFVQRGFRLAPAERCGKHEVRLYVARLKRLQQEFTRLGRADAAAS